MSFQQFKTDPRCLKILKAQRITEPTPVQKQAIPVALEGRDLVATAQTGTGKTLAFVLPALTRLASRRPVNNSMLVITPTRELAQQIHDVIKEFGRALGLRALCLYGGVRIEPQIKELKRGNAIIVATPGRLLDHMNRGTVRFNRLSICVLDEADRMLDMGFLPDIKRILKALPKDRQTMMFAATFAPRIRGLAATMQRDPVRIQVGPVAKPIETVKQGVYTVERSGKMALLESLLGKPHVESALVFLRTKRRTDRVAKGLRKRGFRVQAIHGDRTQSQRQKALDGFRKGRYKVLVATDVAARGIDVEGITHVVNFDVPGTSDDYIHRIGRTARASATGDAITFVSPDEWEALGAIERALGRNLPQEDWEGAVPVFSLSQPAGSGKRRVRRFGGRRSGGSFRRR
jgi:ATP-dependent RNA helicase RhlE